MLSSSKLPKVFEVVKLGSLIASNGNNKVIELDRQEGTGSVS